MDVVYTVRMGDYQCSLHVWHTNRSPGRDVVEVEGHSSQSHFKVGLAAVVGGDGIATDILTVGM